MIARFGRRGSALLLLGLIWALMGCATAFLPESGMEGVPHTELPNMVRGGAWLLSGLAGTFFATRRRPADDGPGFLAVAFMPLSLAASYGVAFVTWLLTSGEFGWHLGIFGVLIYGLLAALVALLASWPDVPEEAKHRKDDEA